MSIVIFVNRFMSGIIASSFETLEDWISKPEAFYFFAVMSLISIAFYWFKVRMMHALLLTLWLDLRLKMADLVTRGK